jgi:hypothetical protein
MAHAQGARETGHQFSERARCGLGHETVSLLGRSAESERLDTFVRKVAAARGQAIVLRGAAGVGKAVLLEYLIASVDGWRVMRCIGVEGEMELACGELHLLCMPIFDGLERLPEPQRDALAGVFGLREGAVRLRACETVQRCESRVRAPSLPLTNRLHAGDFLTQPMPVPTVIAHRTRTRRGRANCKLGKL